MIETRTKPLSALLTGISSQINDDFVGDVLDEGGAYWLDQVRKLFLAEKDIYGNPFKPSLSGLKRKAGGYTYREGKKYTGTGTLFETGRLFHSIHLEEPSPSERALVTDTEYAENLIGSWVFMGISPDLENRVEKMIRLRVRSILDNG